jgi:hypothetical protein
VVLSLEVVEEVDDVRVVSDAIMDHELFGSVVNGQPLRVNGSSGRFGQALEGNLGIGPGVLGLEDHAKGAMIEGSESSKSPVEQRTFLEVVSHALHLMMISARMGEAVVLPTVRDRHGSG